MADLDLMYENACIEIQRHLEDARTSKIAHFEIAAWYDHLEKIMTFTNGLSVALILAWLLSSQFKSITPTQYQPIFQEIIPMILTMIVATVSAVASIVRFRERASENRLAAQKYQTLWRNCMNWRTDFPDSSTAIEAVRCAQRYREQLSEINRDSPQIPEWAWKKVPKEEAKGGTSYDIDERIKT